MTKPALLLVDMQRDFLDRAALSPAKDALIRRASSLLSGWRALGLPLFHVHTLIRPDGTDRMPHWARTNYWACVEGTEGALPPPELAPLPDEPVIRKRFFSAFGNPQLDAALKSMKIDTLAIAGIYLHGCIRATAFDAYERGYETWIAEDVAGSTEPLHAELSRRYLEGRAARFMPANEILLSTGKGEGELAASSPTLPVACIDRHWKETRCQRKLEQHNPSNPHELISAVGIAGQSDVAEAVRTAREAQRPWGAQDNRTRLNLLAAWHRALARKSDELAAIMAREIGKPVNDAREEIERAQAHLESVIRLTEVGESQLGQVTVRHRPLGTIGVITPWNNPVAIPVSKIAAALAFGNTVVWKPAPQASKISMTIMDTFAEAGLPVSTLNLLFGDASAARLLMQEREISAISLTGSIAAGHTATALCLAAGKPLQAELGGNNAMIVLADADLESEAMNLALAAFSFAGQRCTAIRRFIVEKSILGRFEETLIAATQSLRIGEPLDSATQIGPLVAAERRAAVADTVKRAIAGGGRLLCGGGIPAGRDRGYWYSPTLIGDIGPETEIFQEETFGPVAVVTAANNLDQAIALTNHVPHGLVCGLLGGDTSAQDRFAAAAEAGILRLSAGPLAIHPEAPFGGWKASHIGPPEHGRWDLEFYTQPQAVYGKTAKPS